MSLSDLVGANSRQSSLLFKNSEIVVKKIVGFDVDPFIGGWGQLKKNVIDKLYSRIERY